MSTADDIFSVFLGVPHLPGARCVGSAQLFDEFDDEDVVSAAIATCLRCAELQPCRQFVESLPRRHRPDGVTGGVCRRPLKPRLPKEAA